MALNLYVFTQRLWNKEVTGGVPVDRSKYPWGGEDGEDFAVAISLEYEQRAGAFASLICNLAAAGEEITCKLCDCCGFPTLRSCDICETCSLCGWEDDDYGPRFPDEPDAANQGRSLLQARGLFERYLSSAQNSESGAWSEYVPGIRQLKRVIIGAYTAALEHQHAAVVLLKVAADGGRALDDARASLESKFLDTSPERSRRTADVDLESKALEKSIASLMNAFGLSAQRNKEVKGYLDAREFRLAFKTIVYEIVRKGSAVSDAQLREMKDILGLIPGDPDGRLREIISRDLTLQASRAEGIQIDQTD